MLAGVTAAGGAAIERSPRRPRRRHHPQVAAGLSRGPRGPGPSPSATVGVAAAWLRCAARRIHERRLWLTELDAAIGDGDHGINLDRGFAAVLADLQAGALPTDDAGRSSRPPGVGSWGSWAARAARSTGGA